ncbi:uncharacterized protein LOC113231510 [Hyposmocoma kahamanoa]|uniref:uncharacterized protein LOC113231510 n=1 Tax=Hyposmocoma kahamanoa TaxID=1477025 RepID=UPI000E6D6B70|nr:uncharacterized protein LOC113231510 [Hyposmocoma kahamanoa]
MCLDWNWRKADYQALYAALGEIDWADMFELCHVDGAVEFFYSKIYECFNSFVPFRMINQRANRFVYPKWYSGEIIRYLKYKHYHLKKYKAEGKEYNKEMFKFYRWHVKKLINDAYRQHISSLQKNIFNEPARFWGYVKDKRKDRQGVDVYSYDGEEVSGQAAADAFAQYFSSVFQSDPPRLDFEDAARTAHSLADARDIAILGVSESDFKFAIKRLKAKSVVGPDGVPVFLAKDCMSAIRAPLLFIYNLCLNSTKYPHCWKLSCVTPVPKGDAKGDITQYRPIAVLSVFAKIFESILNNQFSMQIDSLLHNSQHGFRRARSTTTNLVGLLDYASAEMDAGRQVDAAYFDSKKAFDLVDNDILLRKLASLGCTPKLLRFFADYLDNRRQFVKVQGFASAEYYTRSGLSQGSTLGPTLFLLMINDLPQVIGTARCLLFADDLKLFLGVNDIADTTALQADIDAVSEWSLANRMPFNNTKCKVITYTRKHCPRLTQYKLFDACIDRVFDICDLGVTLDSRLDFHLHVTTTCKKANSILGFILRTSYEFNDVAVAKVLYNAHVRSKLEYAAIVWDPHEAKYSIMVERVQRKYARWLYRRQYGYYPYLYPSYFVAGMVGLDTLSRRRKMLLLAHYIAAFHHKVDNSIMSKVDLLVPVRVPWGDEGAVAPRRRPRLLHKPVTRTELHKLPPTTFEHVDVTRLLKDITSLKANLAEFRYKLEASENTINDLRAQVVLLSSAVSVSRSPEACNMNTYRGEQNASLGSFESAHMDVSPIAAVVAARVSPRPAPRFSSTLTPQRDYAAVAAATQPTAPQPRQPTEGKMKKRKLISEAVSSVPPRGVDQCDGDGFKKVEKKKKYTSPESRAPTTIQTLDIPCENNDGQDVTKNVENDLRELYPVHVTPLMNEDQHWGCFYIFPELYEDLYSPLVRVVRLDAVPELVGGVLTRDMIAACLTYLKRTPILGDFVCIKLNLSGQCLVNIEVLQHYKYLVYLDLSSNLLTELTVLSHLLYLQFLSVSFNRLTTVLEYETPQWFLTEVHYEYNSVMIIRDITLFWSITVLNLSHNNIKMISGLENLNYLRRLDLSFNNIQRLENLNHLKLIWLDVSYNNISSFEFGTNSGLWTMLYLEYLNLNENKLTSMRMFSGCGRLRELHARNNRLNMFLELAVYMRQLKRLVILDLRENPISSLSGYKDVVINSFPVLLSLDGKDLDPVEQRLLKMHMSPDVTAFATRRLLRLLYIEQLSRARVSPFVPPGDTQEVPIVILVGYEAVGKGTLLRRLADECQTNVELGKLHTTYPFHYPEHFIEVSRSKFDDMLLAGDLLTYCERDGESYGLSREEAFIKDGKVKVVGMDLISALMMKQRGRRPYLILATCSDINAVISRQGMRKAERIETQARMKCTEMSTEKDTLQVLVSGRILVTGILNEILLSFPEDKEQSEFLFESECSLLMDSESRKATHDYTKGVNLFALLNSSNSSLVEANHRAYKQNQEDFVSLCSLYKESQNTDEYASYARDESFMSSSQPKKSADKIKQTSSIATPHKSYMAATGTESAKTSKSVTFTSLDIDTTGNVPNDLSGLMIDPKMSEFSDKLDNRPLMRSISMRIFSALAQGHAKHRDFPTHSDDQELWLTFLADTGVITKSETYQSLSETLQRRQSKVDDLEALLKQLTFYHQIPGESLTSNIRDEYENIHHENPGLFWDVVSMDDPDAAFLKVKRIIKDIVNSQPNLKPMFDIEFSDMDKQPIIKKKLADITKTIAPVRLFF